MNILYWILKTLKWALYITVISIFLYGFVVEFTKDGYSGPLRVLGIAIAVLVAFVALSWLMYTVEQRTGKKI